MARTQVRHDRRAGDPGNRSGGGGKVPGTRSARPLRSILAGGAAWSTPEVTPPARWRPVLALLLALAGTGVSTYLTVAHFAKIPLVCSSSGIVNCERVTSSAQSYFLGIPVAFLGLLFFVAMTAINLPVVWRAADRRIHMARLAFTVLGMGFVLYLVSAELLIIKNICLWCTSVHVITFALFVLMMTTIPQMLGWAAGGRSET